MKPEINTATAETVQTGGDQAVVQERLVRHLPAIGDYVLATKYGDGDPQDHWCVGFYAGLTNPEKYNPPRYDVVDGEGKNFRGNGFRRIKKITPERGAWMLKHAKDIELSGRSVWHFARCSMNPPPNVQAELRTCLARLVLLGAQGVTSRFVSSSAWLGSVVFICY